MNEFIEKLIGRLEEEMAGHLNLYCDGLIKAMSVAKELAEECKPKTQSDKIRAMSDAELAELFAQYSCEDADYTSLLPIKDCKWGTRREVIDRNLKWLKSEVE